MLCTIYKSSKKADTYLYIEKRDDFSRVPEKLLETFGSPIMVMLLNLGKQQTLALADKANVIAGLRTQGFYLQLPPPAENLLQQHQKQQEKMGQQYD